MQSLGASLSPVKIQLNAMLLQRTCVTTQTQTRLRSTRKMEACPRPGHQQNDSVKHLPRPLPGHKQKNSVKQLPRARCTLQYAPSMCENTSTRLHTCLMHPRQEGYGTPQICKCTKLNHMPRWRHLVVDRCVANHLQSVSTDQASNSHMHAPLKRLD